MQTLRERTDTVVTRAVNANTVGFKMTNRSALNTAGLR